METTRDLGDIELWQQSLERSLARRGKLARSSIELYRLQPQRDLAAPDLFLESASYWQARRRAAANRPGVPRPVVALGGLSALTLVSVTTLPGLLASRHRRAQQVAFTARAPEASMLGNGQPHRVSLPAPAATKRAVAARPKTEIVSQSMHLTPAKTTASTVHTTLVHTPKPAPKPAVATHVTRPAKPAVPHPAPKPPVRHAVAPKPPAPAPTPPPKPTPQPASHTGYVNPLEHASVTPERIDQGVDYAGTGTLVSIGQARITYAATGDTGWPGAFIEYQLLDGPDAGRYVYYAEGVSPASGIAVGKVVQAGQAVATLIPGWSTGIEIGWGAGIGTETYAAEHGEHTYPTPAGESFSALIASLGGPPGV